MTQIVTVLRAGPQVSVQDGGRAGGLGIGLSRGGAADRQGYLAGLALVDLPLGAAAIECAGLGGAFRFSVPTRFALTGAEMRADLDGQPVDGMASHLAGPGSVLEIKAITSGVYGYLTFGGGLMTEVVHGGRGYHRIGGFGQPLAEGDALPLGPDAGIGAAPHRLPKRAESGAIRVMPGPQTAIFPEAVRQNFASTTFTRSARANRQGVRLDHDGDAFSMGAQLSQVSDFISEGDVQMTGDGTPYVLLADCQTIGGYPRIGTVLPVDLHRIAQAGQGERLTFQFVTLDAAEASWMSDEAQLAAFKAQCEPRLRDPREMADLLNYELISKPEIEI